MKSAISIRKPTFAEEIRLSKQGFHYIAGVDEVGRGALAGPVAAAAVVLRAGMRPSWIKTVRDSKQLSARQRETLYIHIMNSAVAVGIGMVDCRLVDEYGIAPATRIAMKLAIERLSPAPDYLIIDYLRLPDIDLPQKGIIDGDAICVSIACASIIAKVTRDRLMAELDAAHDGYNFAGHKGYGTEEHLSCLEKLGPSPVHRLSFKPFRSDGEE